MFWFIVLTFPINFALGSAVAVAVHRRLSAPLRLPPAVGDVPESEDVQDTTIAPTDVEFIQIASAATAVEDDIPAAWLKLLEQQSITSQSFVEASVQVLRLEVWRYRQKLVSIEGRVRACFRVPDIGVVKALLRELREVNEDWLAKQAEAAVHLGERRGGLGNFEEVGGNLESVLLDQQAQIETTCSNLNLLDFETDFEAGCKRLMTEILRLLDLAHVLRDRMQESLVTILRADRRLDEIERGMQRDGLTNLLNRTGMEVALHEWWRHDVARQRLVSVVLVDLDDCGKMNERIGTRNGDQVLAAFGKLLDDLVPKDRGYHHCARIAGQLYAVFCGDTGPRQAMGLAERIRQTIAATTFSVVDHELDLTVSCGVTEIQKDDTPEKLYKRLRLTLKSAKTSGRNCATLDEGHGPTMAEPPQFQVKARIVRVDEELRAAPVEDAAMC